MGDECIRDKTVIEMCEMKIIPKDNNDEINLQPMQNYTAGQVMNFLKILVLLSSSSK